MRAAAALALSLSVCAGAGADDRPPVIVQRDDAFIAHQAGDNLWWIGSANLELVVGFDAAGALSLQRLANPTGRTWDIAPASEVGLTAGTDRITLAASGTTTLLNVDTRASEFGVVLTFNFEYGARRLLVSRVYACYGGSPTIETWTRISSASGDSTALTDLVAWRMTMPLGHVRWLGGLRGDSAGGTVEDAFVVADRDLDPGERIDLGAEGRSSESYVPLVVVNGDRDQFFGGLMWSGAWHAALERIDARLRVTIDFPGVATTVTPGRTLELPHAFFGINARDATDESGALHQFILRGIRRGRPFQPLVTYNTWFAYGTSVNEDAMVAEMDRAAALGVELFVIDAGWYVGAGETSDFDFESGLGSWQPDPERFPSGLGSLSDYAHGAGMKFGIWVEPERVALSTVDGPGLVREPWLAKRNGDYGSLNAAQICLARPEARQWVLDRLVSLIETVRPDYLKWDNNAWINCNRPDHGHGADDGNLMHVQALYGLLEELRRRYPDLLIENVSGGGSRIDFGLAAYTDVAWMDDRTAPAAHVRHNIEGLTFAFPPAYLLSFLIDADREPIAGAADLPFLTRSRGAAILGLTYRTELLDPLTASLLAIQINEYKGYRDLIARANATLLTLQTPYDDSGWDVLEELTDDAATALIFGFKAEQSNGRLLVRPRGLIPDADYEVSSVDTGPLGGARGELLMTDGIELVHAGGSSRAHVLVLQIR